MSGQKFRFQFTHIKHGDQRAVGILPVPTSPDRIAYAYQDLSSGGQTFETGKEEFHRLFRPI